MVQVRHVMCIASLSMLLRSGAAFCLMVMQFVCPRCWYHPPNTPLVAYLETVIMSGLCSNITRSACTVLKVRVFRHIWMRLRLETSDLGG